MPATTPDPQPRLATPDELTALAAVLGDAFAEYAWTRWTVPGEDAHRRLAELQHLYLAHAHEHGGRIWTTPGREAAAVVIPADLPDPSEETFGRIVALHGEGWQRVVDHEQSVASLRPEADWTLATVGVAPERHGQGLGSAVLRAALADLGSARVLLETSSADNVRLYERLGFETVEHVRGDGPDVWIMLR